MFFFFSSRRRHTRFDCDWSSNVCSSDLVSGADRPFLSVINPNFDSFTFRANDKGLSIVDPNSAKLTIDGQVVPLTASPKVGDATDFSYKPAAPFPPNSDHTYSIEVKDTLGNTVAAAGSFKTINYTL